MMSTVGRAGRLVLFVVAGMLVMVNQAQAAESCHKINAKGVGLDHGDFTTDAKIIGGGLLQGTTHSVFAPTGVNGSIVSFVGNVTFTTNNGTLTVSIAGTLDTSSGTFSGTGSVTGATGKLAGATGTLTFDGVEDLSTGVFVEDVTGTICVDLAP
jgi:hypothetical protein